MSAFIFAVVPNDTGVVMTRLPPYIRLTSKAESAVDDVCKIWIFVCVSMFGGFQQSKEDLESENEKGVILLLSPVVSGVSGLPSVSGGTPPV